METVFASPEATKSFAEHAIGSDSVVKPVPGNYRKSAGLTLSSIGIGTYLGNWDEETDSKYTDAVVEYVKSGGNVIDTASNYRFQRSERSIGAAIRELADHVDREALFICSKGGYLPFDNEPASDVGAYFEEHFVKTGVAAAEDLVGGSHCMTAGYLKSQIDQSLKNIGISGLDLFYIHNPEAQLAEIDRYSFEARIAAAFEGLEEYRAAGKINHFGIATWNGFRCTPDDSGYHSLERFVNIANQVGGEKHGFRYIQLPHNLAMPEAYLVPNQAANGKALSAIAAAVDLGLDVMASASLLQGQLTMNVPMHIREALGGLTTDAMTSIQFVRSTPGVTSALVGMSSLEHVRENMALAACDPAEESVYEEMFSMGQQA
ncbi:MAG: aldo/keto reductase [Pyrinomonadaceae bacterium]|nr:aldo/keto reductase [Pyrinomonadaceae bacterium]